MTLARGIVLVAAFLLPGWLAAQPMPGEFSQAEVERIRVEKKAWIALNMDLTPADGEAFWPIYESYQKELGQINVRLVRLIDSYGNHYRNNTLTDEIARKLAEESMAVDEAELKLRRSCLNRLAKVLPARKAARYVQLEGRVHTQVRYELAANLPLVGDVRPDIPRSIK